ncbi:MAG: hypothetical protein ACRDY1_12380, partial [Acidimicrobiales bacterium]
MGTGTNDPLAEMKLLAAHGNSITALGTKTIDGVLTSGYSVALSRQNYLKSEQKAVTEMGLTRAQQQELLQVAQSFPVPTISVWFD